MTAARLAIPPARTPAELVRLHLPEPPSANALLRNVSASERATALRHGKSLPGRVKSAAYLTWANAAGWELASQRPGRIEGRYELTIAVSEDARLDLDNAPKAVSDLAQTHGLIANDRLAERVIVERDPAVPPRRIMVTLKPWGVAHG